MKRGVELSMHEEGITMLRRERKQTHPVCHACSYHLCLSTSLIPLHYSGSYVHSWVHVRLVVLVPHVLHIDGTIVAEHVRLDARCLACWQKDEQSSRKK